MAEIFFDLADRLRACLCTQVALLPDPPQRCEVMVGSELEFLVSLSEDYCRCGTAWVRISEIVSTEVFPTPQEQFRHCLPDQWAMTLEVGIVRCPPVGDAGVLPTPAELSAFAATVMLDAQAMRKAISCCFTPPLEAIGRQWIMGSWQAFGPMGMCAGGRMPVQVQVLCMDSCP
jgi:hypothetical protein